MLTLCLREKKSFQVTNSAAQELMEGGTLNRINYKNLSNQFQLIVRNLLYSQTYGLRNSPFPPNKTPKF